MPDYFDNGFVKAMFNNGRGLFDKAAQLAGYVPRKEYRQFKKAWAMSLRAALSPGGPGFWSQDHWEQTDHFSGWNYVAIRAVALQAAAATMSVYEDLDEAQTTFVKARSLGFSYQKSLDMARRLHKAFDDEKVDQKLLPKKHPLCKLLDRPSKQQSGASFRYEQAVQMHLTGVNLNWMCPNMADRTVERYVIPTALATPMPPSYQYPRGGWKIQPMTNYSGADDGFADTTGYATILGRVLSSEYVEVTRWPHPLYKGDGYGPLAGGSQWSDAADQVDRARWAQMKQGADPSLVVTPDKDTDMDEEDLERLLTRLSQRYGGADKAGAILAMTGGATVEKLSMTPTEMAYQQTFEQMQRAILALHGVPPVAAGAQEGGSYASFFASLKQFIMLTVQPLLSHLAEEDTYQQAIEFGDNLTVVYTAQSINDEELLERQLQNDLAGGIRTLDEWRALRNLPPDQTGMGDQYVRGAAGGKGGSVQGSGPLGDGADAAGGGNPGYGSPTAEHGQPALPRPNDSNQQGASGGTGLALRVQGAMGSQGAGNGADKAGGNAPAGSLAASSGGYDPNNPNMAGPEHAKQAGIPAQGPTIQGSHMTATVAVMKELTKGHITAVVAEELLVAMGIMRDRAAAMVADQAQNAKEEIPPPPKLLGFNGGGGPMGQHQQDPSNGQNGNQQSGNGNGLSDQVSQRMGGNKKKPNFEKRLIMEMLGVLKRYNPDQPRVPAGGPNGGEFASHTEEEIASRRLLRKKIRSSASEAHPNPTPAQKEAGNYKMGHIRLHGMDISIETPKGFTRKKVSKTGKSWRVTMPFDYGYLKRTEGFDGDHVDIAIGPHPHLKTVYVVNQYKPDSGVFDEHKCLIGYTSAREAKAAYMSSFADGFGKHVFGSIVSVPLEDFKRWAYHGDMSKPLKALAVKNDLASALKSLPVADAAALQAQIEEADDPDEIKLLLQDVFQPFWDGTKSLGMSTAIGSDGGNLVEKAVSYDDDLLDHDYDTYDIEDCERCAEIDVAVDDGGDDELGLEKTYNSDEPRNPAGQAGGGRWTSGRVYSTRPGEVPAVVDDKIDYKASEFHYADSFNRWSPDAAGAEQPAMMFIQEAPYSGEGGTSVHRWVTSDSDLRDDDDNATLLENGPWFYSHDDANFSAGAKLDKLNWEFEQQAEERRQWEAEDNEVHLESTDDEPEEPALSQDDAEIESKLEGTPWKYESDGAFVANFKADNGHAFEVGVGDSPLGNNPSGGIQQQTFYFSDETPGVRGGQKFGITGRGSAHQVIGKVSDLFVTYMDRVKPELMHFSAAEESRQKLYEFMAARAHRKLGENYQVYKYKHNLGPGGGMTSFVFVRNDAVDKVEASSYGSEIGHLSIIKPKSWADIEEMFEVASGEFLKSYNPDQPRVPAGQPHGGEFASKTSTGMGPMERPDPEQLAEADVLVEAEPSGPEEAEQFLDNVARHPYHVETTERLKAYHVVSSFHKKKDGTPNEGCVFWSEEKYRNKDGTWQAERAAKHEEIANKLINPAAVADPDKKPIAFVLMGPPAAGKTSVGAKFAAKFGIQFTTINPDDMKEQLPEYEGWNAGLLHEESSQVSEGIIRQRAEELRHNLLFDITGTNAGKIKKMVDELSEKGYDVHICEMAVPPETCAWRAWQRFRKNAFGHHDPNEKPGRFVPPVYAYKHVDHRPEEIYKLLRNDPRVRSYMKIRQVKNPGGYYANTVVEEGENVPMAPIAKALSEKRKQHANERITSIQKSLTAAQNLVEAAEAVGRTNRMASKDVKYWTKQLGKWQKKLTEDKDGDE